MELGPVVTAFFRRHGREDLTAHVAQVARTAREIAPRAGVAPDFAEAAAWIHDLGRVVPADQAVAMARVHGLEVLPEEERAPGILHGKLSCVLASELFGALDPVVLDAVRCHTTLRPGATPLDKVLFVADKLSWDPAHLPDGGAGLAGALARSVDEAVHHFLAGAWVRREQMPVIHPWFREACAEYLRT